MPPGTEPLSYTRQMLATFQYKDELRENCSFNYYAVLSAAGASRYPNLLHDTLEALACDSDKSVRIKIAAQFHEASTPGGGRRALPWTKCPQGVSGCVPWWHPAALPFLAAGQSQRAVPSPLVLGLGDSRDHPSSSCHPQIVALLGKDRAAQFTRSMYEKLIQDPQHDVREEALAHLK